MDKYYKPEIEEFFVGFEYERCDDGYTYFKDVYPRAVSQNKLESYLLYFRVKLLDKEDIESLGFKLKTDLYIKDNLTLQVHNDSITIKYYGRFDDECRTLVEQINIKNKSELIKLLKQLRIE